MELNECWNIKRSVSLTYLTYVSVKQIKSQMCYLCEITSDNTTAKTEYPNVHSGVYTYNI